VVKLSPNMPLDGFAKDWSDSRFSMKELYKGELISVAVKHGEDKAFTVAFKKAYGTPPPAPNHMAEIKGGFAFWSGQGQYMLLISEGNIHTDIEVKEALNDTAYTTLQSDGWASLNLTGARIFDVLERFVPLNLRATPAHYAARTSAHHMVVIVLKFNDTDIQLLTPRSSAQSFLDGLVHIADNLMA